MRSSSLGIKANIQILVLLSTLWSSKVRVRNQVWRRRMFWKDSTPGLVSNSSLLENGSSMSSRSHRRDKSNDVITLDFRPNRFRKPTIAENLKTGLQKFQGSLRMPSLPKLNTGLAEPNPRPDLQTRSATTVGRRRKTLPREGKSGDSRSRCYQQKFAMRQTYFTFW